jgi:hypothetical protein
MQIPIWVLLVIGGILIVVILSLLWLGYTVYSEITGFGPHVVKKTETFAYNEGEDEPVKTSETRETQTRRTIWDWMTVLTISAVIAVATTIFTWSQAQKQQDIQDQQARDAILQTYLDQMTEMLLADENSLLKSEPRSPERVAARVRTVTVLKRLDGEHNQIGMTFLRESGSTYALPSYATPICKMPASPLLTCPSRTWLTRILGRPTCAALT